MLYHTKSHPLIPYTINPIPLALGGGSYSPFSNRGRRGGASNTCRGLGLARFKIEYLLGRALIQ